MKKVVSLIVTLAIMFSALSSAFASTKSASLKSIKYARSGSQDKITLYTANYKGYNVIWMKNPDRLVIDIPNNKLTIQGKQTIAVNSELLKSIRFSQLTKTTVRVVFDTTGKIPYTVKPADGSLTFLLGNAAQAQIRPGNTSDVNRGDVERPAPTQKRLTFSSTDTSDILIIPGSNYDGYNVIRLTDPDRIVVDVPNLTVPADQQLMSINSKYASVVRTSAVNSSSTRIVFETIGQPQYHIEKSADQLAVILDAPALKNVTYHNTEDSIYLFLPGAKLTEVVQSGTTDGSTDSTAKESGNLKHLYTDGYDDSQIKYTMTFAGNLANTGFGTLSINDGIMDSIDVTSDPATGNTTITFNAKSRFTYETVTNAEANTTEISILKPFAAGDKLVVIDAGHGGSDPGAQYAGLNEKDFNLKIALKVNEILKNNNIRTYMIREDDSFVPLQTRADIANNLNAALFLSIHNNAYNTSEHGTETLYYPGSAGSNFANNVQDTLVNALGTYDRGIIQRPNLVVLYSTKMPAVIAEVAFLTNKDDRAKLTDDAFIQKAAQALADAVIKTLGQK